MMSAYSLKSPKKGQKIKSKKNCSFHRNSSPKLLHLAKCELFYEHFWPPGLHTSEAPIWVPPSQFVNHRCIATRKTDLMLEHGPTTPPSTYWPISNVNDNWFLGSSWWSRTVIGMATHWPYTSKRENGKIRLFFRDNCFTLCSLRMCSILSLIFITWWNLDALKRSAERAGNLFLGLWMNFWPTVFWILRFLFILLSRKLSKNWVKKFRETIFRPTRFTDFPHQPFWQKKTPDVNWACAENFLYQILNSSLLQNEKVVIFSLDRSIYVTSLWLLIYSRGFLNFIIWVW